MLRTRLWMGAILILMTVGALVIDQRLGPWYPFLFVLVLVLACASCSELLGLLGGEQRPAAWGCYLALIAIIGANWLPHMGIVEGDAWHWIVGTFTAVVLGAFLVEMASFRGAGESVGRIGMTIWIAAYL